ncbi:hypothetical protein TVAG_332610 [Trichomonas vaginalis G3]|uniref:Uncharacterized protein n=1 Tax=Trichomonas vaginalis (strain ATCC PRA-98 / G3) TaxID=412133 RepID=A2FAD4_TRIV3|nr:heterochromatin maintenance [Trichomonas vaginalis G3]EAX98151.1 hypothetical protein TVAG_332610 [Trichomonas vaginalis G3]KAI5484867.1 heterochromatin maintenance [Trichomonas vaginalis G3]|eukprot:XP_001311081.1 hypothetical protein [Trichomonas vaginalis G3]
MSSEPQKQVRDVHFGSPKQIVFDNDGMNIYSLGSSDGSIFKMIKDEFSSDPMQILESQVKDQITAMLFMTDENNLLIAVKNKLKLAKNLPTISGVSDIYTEDDADIIGIVQDPQTGHIFVNTETRITVLQKSGKKILTLCDGLDPISWVGIGPVCHSIAVATSSGLFVYSGENSTEPQIKRLEKDTPQPVFSPSSELLIANPLRSGVVNIYNLTEQTESAVIITKHSTPISHITISKSSSIISADREGNIYISKYDKKVLKFGAISPPPQPIAVDVVLNYGSFAITCLSASGGSVICGEEDGKEILWHNVIPGEFSKPKQIISESSKKSAPKQKNTVQKKVDIMEALKKPIDPSKLAKKQKEDFSLSESDDEERPKKARPPPPKPKPKPKKQSKPKKKNDDEYSEDFEEEEGLEPLINDKSDNLEEEEKNEDVPNVEDNGPVITAADFLEEESETSSGHELDEVDENGNIIEKPDKIEEELDDFEDNKNEDEVSDSTDTSSGDELENIFGKTTLQFMPNNCSHFSANRRYMSWNLSSAVYLRVQSDSAEEFIDVHPIGDSQFQEMHMTNIHKFTMATCDKYGFMGASLHTLEYRPHNPWSQDAITSLDVNREEIRLIAIGKEWFSIGTDSNSVTIFKSSGLEMGTFSYPHQIITMVGHENLLLIVHGSDLLYEFIDVDERKTIASGEIPGDQPLKWIGFSEEGSPMILDGSFVVHLMTSDFSNSWVPISNLSKLFDDNIGSFWVVGASEKKILVCPLRHSKTPPTSRVPHLREIDFTPLTIGNQSSMAYLLAKIDSHTPQVDREMNADKELMKMLAESLKEGKEEMAYDLINGMVTTKARNIAIAYADQLGKTELVDRLTGESSIKVPKKKSKKQREEDKETKEHMRKFIEASLDKEKVYVRKDSRIVKNSVEVQQPSSFTQQLASIKSTTSSRKSLKNFLNPPPAKGPVKKKTNTAPRKKKDTKVEDVKKLVEEN